MKRTQLYLDDHLWNTLHARAKTRQTTVSALVREAVREWYVARPEERANAMRAFVGIRKAAPGEPDAVTMVRNLRSGQRIDRVRAK